MESEKEPPTDTLGVGGELVDSVDVAIEELALVGW